MDHGPMEGYWGVLKSEMYDLKKDELTQAIETTYTFTIQRGTSLDYIV